MEAQVLEPSWSYASGVIGDGLSCWLTRVYSFSDGQKTSVSRAEHRNALETLNVEGGVLSGGRNGGVMVMYGGGAGIRFSKAP
jgi:hypothetical protein